MSTQSISRSVKALVKRREWLVQRLAEHPDRDFHKEEIQAIDTAVRCMKLVRSYGFVRITDYGPLLGQQEDNPKLCYGKPDKK